MSHVVGASDYPITDLEALATAAQECGLEMRHGQTTYKWYGRFMNDYHGQDAAYKNGVNPDTYGQCLHALRVKGNSAAYEVGVIQNPNGAGYSLIWDNYANGHGLMTKIGDDGNKLRQAYGVAVLTKAAVENGYHVTGTVTGAGGVVQITVER